MTNPKFHVCPTCGYKWPHGYDGDHDCTVLLREKIQNLERCLELKQEHGGKDKTYLALKNIIHNELGVSRQDVMTVIEEAAQGIIEAAVKKISGEEGHTLSDRIDQAMSRQVRRIVDPSSYSGQQKLVEGVAKAITKQLIITIKERPSG